MPASQPQFIVSNNDFNGKIIIGQKSKATQSFKSEKNGNNQKIPDEVIIIDEDDLPLAKQILLDSVKEKSDEKNGNESVKQAFPEEVLPVVVTERESTPKNKSRANEKSPRSEKKNEGKVEPLVEEVAVISTIFAEDNCFDEEKELKQTKVVKLTADVLSSGTASSTRRSDRLVNASTIVNLSTVSDQSSKTVDDICETNYNVSSNKVSGRRSTRPIKDICFSYRSLDASLDSSVNATVGSEIHSSCLMTPAGFKRQIGSNESIDSPKRARLDFSGFLSTLSSPVTLLRNKFKNAQIQSSTPNRDEDFQEISSEEKLSASEEGGKETVEDDQKVVSQFEDTENPKRHRCIIM